MGRRRKKEEEKEKKGEERERVISRLYPDAIRAICWFSRGHARGTYTDLFCLHSSLPVWSELSSLLVVWFLDSGTSCHVCSRVSDKSVCIVQSVCEQSACVNIVNVCAFE